MAEISESWGSVDESLRRRFEAAWKAGMSPDVGEFLPDAGDSRYAGTLAELIVIDLEMGWRRGTKRTVEQYRSQFELLRSDAGLARRLVCEEFRIRHRFGDRPNIDDFRRLYPEHADAINTLIENVTQPTLLRAGGPDAAAVDARYRVDGEQGRGGFGMVWRAADKTLGREVAIKQLIGPAAGDADMRRRFLGEARIAAQLQHPGVVPVYDIGGETDRPYYTMKLVAGHTLAEAIRKFHESPDSQPGKAVERVRLLAAFQSLARTMAFVHAKGVLHRDLKPQNIILGDFGETILLDWGLAKILGDPTETLRAKLDADSPQDLTQPGTIMGTPAYMSPEQAAGRTADIDRRSDVFSLGIILFHILTGKRPFAGTDSAEVCAKIVNDPPPSPRSLRSDISRPLEAICLRCLEKNPDDRYADAGKLNQDLERYLAGEPVNAYAEPWWYRLGRWARRHRALIANAAMAVALFGVIVAAGFFVQRFQKERDLRAVAHVKDVEESALKAEALAVERFRRGAFRDAVRVLDEALSSLAAWPDLAPLRTRLEGRRDRAHRLSEFYRLQDQGWRDNYYEHDDEAAAVMKQALDFLGVIDNPNWWNELPTDELSPEQIAQLKEDAHGVLLLYAGTIAKPALQEFPTTKYKAESKRALDLCRQAQIYKKTQGGSLLEIFCRYNAGEINLLQIPKAMRDMTTRSPTTPIDHHIMGTGHIILSWDDNPLKTFFKLLQGIGDPGLDWETPAFTSQRYLREVTRAEPTRYWAYVWLGFSLQAQKDYLGAELAYNTCITLRPGDAMGYAGRGHALFDQAWVAKTDEQKKVLRERAEQDFRRAIELAPHEPEIRRVRYLCYSRLGDTVNGQEDLFSFFDMVRPLSHMQTHANRKMFEGELIALEKILRPIVADPTRTTPKLGGILALVLFHRGKTAEALAEIAAVPADSPERVRLRPLEAWIKSQSVEPLTPESIAAIEALIADSPPDAFRSAFAKVHLANRRGATAEALDMLQTMDVKPAKWTSWQRLEILVAMARAQSDLGRAEIGRDILDRARRDFGATADAIAKKR